MFCTFAVLHCVVNLSSVIFSGESKHRSLAQTMLCEGNRHVLKITAIAVVSILKTGCVPKTLALSVLEKYRIVVERGWLGARAVPNDFIVSPLVRGSKTVFQRL